MIQQVLVQTRQVIFFYQFRLSAAAALLLYSTGCLHLSSARLYHLIIIYFFRIEEKINKCFPIVLSPDGFEVVLLVVLPVGHFFQVHQFRRHFRRVQIFRGK